MEKLSIKEFRQKIAKMVKEELERRLSEEEEPSTVNPTDDNKPTPRRFEKVWSKISSAEKEKFGAWVKAKFQHKIPAETENKDVIDFLDKHPSAVKLNPAQLVDMFTTMPSIQKVLGTEKAEDDIDDVEDLLDKGEVEFDREKREKENKEKEEKNVKQHGEVSLEDLAQIFGISKERVRQIEGEAIETILARFGNKPLSRMTSDDKERLRIRYDSSVESATNAFLKALITATQDAGEKAGMLVKVEKLKEILRKLRLTVTESTEEKAAMAHLLNYINIGIKKGNASLARDAVSVWLEQDLEDASMELRSVMIPAYQDLIAKAITKNFK